MEVLLKRFATRAKAWISKASRLEAEMAGAAFHRAWLGALGGRWRDGAARVESRSLLLGGVAHPSTQ